ncbi:MAG: dihydrolipoyl dehydrogenase [Lentisphaeria bacterium]|nr:dihydrolipoyl dehydrogenase [Lentisphaeria bacterium]
MVDLAVIGAGPGGYEAAAYAARLGTSVVLYEKGALGGVCLNVGCIPTKTLLRSARAFSDCREASRYGVQAGDPVLDLGAVQARKREVVSTLGKGVAALLKQSGVTLVREEARIVGRGRIESASGAVDASHILVASGSVPALPPIPGLGDSPAVLDSSGILELTAVPASLVIIGAGVIGLEFACFFAEFGTSVTVVEMLDRIAPVLDAEIARKLQGELRRRKVAFHLSARVTRVDGHAVLFTDAEGREQRLEGEWVLNATGRKPVLEGLGLEAAGVDLGRAGIRVDECGRTNVPGIWACGDCTGRMLLAHSAAREGIVAVNSMFGRPDRMRFGAVPSVVYTHPEVAQVGATEEALRSRGVGYRKAVLPMGVAGRFLVEEAGRSGTVKALVSERRGQVLGVHMIGGSCGEFIAAAAAMVELELCVEDVRQIVFPHPTISEALKEVVLHAGQASPSGGPAGQAG